MIHNVALVGLVMHALVDLNVKEEAVETYVAEYLVVQELPVHLDSVFVL